MERTIKRRNFAAYRNKEKKGINTGDNMKIPKYVQKIIDKRCMYGRKLQDASNELDEWLVKHGIEVCNDYTTTGCMVYCEPDTARIMVMESIWKK